MPERIAAKRERRSLPRERDCALREWDSCAAREGDSCHEGERWSLPRERDCAMREWDGCRERERRRANETSACACGREHVLLQVVQVGQPPRAGATFVARGSAACAQSAVADARSFAPRGARTRLTPRREKGTAVAAARKGLRHVRGTAAKCAWHRRLRALRRGSMRAGAVFPLRANGRFCRWARSSCGFHMELVVKGERPCYNTN